MSLLDKVSLLLTANAVKSSKLYSVIPEDGSGDLTLVRNTTATRVNVNGIDESVGLNVPRLNYDSVGGEPSLLIETQRTNTLLNSATVVTQSISTTAVVNTLSFTGTGTITLSGTFTGSLVGTGANNRVNLIFTPTAGTLNLSVSGTCLKGQLEIGGYLSSNIPTLSAAVTRNADLFNKTDIYNNGFITNSGGTLFLHLINNVPLLRDSNSRVLYLGDAAANAGGNGFSIINVSGTAARLTFFKVINGSNIALYTSVNDNLKIAIKWNGTTADVFANGSKVVSQTAFTATQLNFLYNTFGGGQKSSFKAIGLFPSPLTDAECITLIT